MPAPEKKRYSKVHLAYLIIICFLKQTLSMDTIKKIIPVGIETDEVKKIYSSFVENQHKAFSYVLDNVKKVAAPILGQDSEKRMTDLVIQVSIASNICKILTENIINDTGKEWKKLTSVYEVSFFSELSVDADNLSQNGDIGRDDRLHKVVLRLEAEIAGLFVKGLDGYLVLDHGNDHLPV